MWFEKEKYNKFWSEPKEESISHVKWWDDYCRFRLSPHIDGLGKTYVGMGRIAVYNGRLVVPELSIPANEGLHYFPEQLGIREYHGVYLVPQWHTFLKIDLPYADGDELRLAKVNCVSPVGGHLIRAFQHRELPDVQVYADHVFLPLEFFASDIRFSDGLSIVFVKRLLIPTPERLKTVVQALGDEGFVSEKMYAKYENFLKKF